MTDCRKFLAGTVGELKKYGLTEISVAIGVFDGVHAGHRKLLAELLKQAASSASEPVAVTFSPHPRQVLFPNSAPPLLISPTEKNRLLFDCGVRGVVTIPFTPAFAALTPENFIASSLLAEGVHLHSVCVGKNWRFGAGGTGNTASLAVLAGKYGFKSVAVREAVLDGETVSSSAVRLAVERGDLAKAERFLGRRCELSGEVVHGHHIASTVLDHPTANLQLQSGILPPAGVYAAFARRENAPDRFHAVVNIGSAPTFQSDGIQNPLRIEAHLLNYRAPLYGECLTLELAAAIRPERRFVSPEALKAQIALDIEYAETLLRQKEQIYARP